MLTNILQNIIPSTSGKMSSLDNYSYILGIGALFSYSFFWLIDSRISGLAEVLLLITFCISFSRTMDSKIKKDPLIVLFVGWVLFQVGVHLWVKDIFPELASSQINGARHYSKVFLLFIVAWGLRGSVNSVVTILLATVVGFILGGTFGGEGIMNAFNKLMAHQPIDLGYLNSQHTSVYSAFTLLTLVCLSKRILGYFPAAWRRVGALLLYAGILFSVFGVIATQTRASWLGLIVSGTLSASVYIFLRMFRHPGKEQTLIRFSIQPRQFLGPLFILLFIAGLIIKTDGLTLFKDRINSERDVAQTLLEGNIDNVRISSIGIRVISWKNALQFIKERPLTGWGPSSNRALFKKTTLHASVKSIGHFHNSYIELALAYGAFGMTTFTLMVGIIGLRTWQAWQRGDLPDDLMLFACSFFIYWLVVNFFESYIIFNTGFYLNAIVGGSLYTFHIKHLQRSLQQSIQT